MRLEDLKPRGWILLRRKEGTAIPEGIGGYVERVLQQLYCGKEQILGDAEMVGEGGEMVAV
jgi:hypothetical protein